MHKEYFFIISPYIFHHKKSKTNNVSCFANKTWPILLWQKDTQKYVCRTKKKADLTYIVTETAYDIVYRGCILTSDWILLLFFYIFTKKQKYNFTTIWLREYLVCDDMMWKSWKLSMFLSMREWCYFIGKFTFTFHFWCFLTVETCWDESSWII